MTYTTSVGLGCYWRRTSGALTMLERPPPGPVLYNPGIYDTGQADPVAISDDGSVIVGTAISSNQADSGAVRWDNGVMTYLTPLTYPAMNESFLPKQCSADASVIIGLVGNNIKRPIGYWTDGGITASILPPSSDGIFSFSEVIWRSCSSDGHVIVGTSAVAQGTRWVDGVPTSVNGHTYEASFVRCCSSDGSMLAGFATDGTGYWSAPDLNWHPTNMPGIPTAINVDNTVIWSYDQNHSGYTDNLGSQTDGIYGTPHLIVSPDDGVPVFLNETYYAEDTFSPNPVSASNLGDTSAGLRGVRIVGITIYLLDIGSYTDSVTTGISGDGQFISGFVIDSSHNNTPCYWDAAGSLHLLILPEGTTTATTAGISRDGSVIFGVGGGSVEISDPVVANELRLVSLYPQDLPDNLFSFYSENQADFPPSFGQYSLSMWCCEAVTLQWPKDGTVRGLLRVTPSQCYAEFRDLSETLLFSGTFINPNSDPPDLYKLSFSIDTEAGVVVCFGDNTEWTSTDAVFASLGQIGNVT